MEVKIKKQKGHVVEMSILNNPAYQSRLEKIYYDSGGGCLTASEQILRTRLIAERRDEDRVPFERLRAAWDVKDKPLLRELLGWMYVEDLYDGDIEQLYKYISTVKELEVLYNNIPKARRFLASLLYI